MVIEMSNIPEYLLTASSDDQLATYALADWVEENNDNSLFVRREEEFPLAIEQCIMARFDSGYGGFGGDGNLGGYGGFIGHGGDGSNGGCGKNRYYYTNHDYLLW